MSRSLYKGRFVHMSLLKMRTKSRSRKPRSRVIRTSSRASVILPHFVGRYISVYNGQRYVPINIQQDCIGHKLGEFSMCVKFGKRIHLGDSRRKNKNKK